jgi:hypothetical protein
MIQEDAHHGTRKDTDPGRDRAIVIAHQHPQIRRPEQIHDAAHLLGGLANWRGCRLTLELRYHHRWAGEGRNPPTTQHDQGPPCAHRVFQRQAQSGTASLHGTSQVRGPQLPVLCQPKKHQAGVQRQQLGADLCTDLLGRCLGRCQQPLRPQDVFDALGQPRHCHSPAQNAGASQHQRHCRLPLQQPQFAQGGSGVGLNPKIDLCHL